MTGSLRMALGRSGIEFPSPVITFRDLLLGIQRLVILVSQADGLADLIDDILIRRGGRTAHCLLTGVSLVPRRVNVTCGEYGGLRVMFPQFSYEQLTSGIQFGRLSKFFENFRARIVGFDLRFGAVEESISFSELFFSFLSHASDLLSFIFVHN